MNENSGSIGVIYTVVEVYRGVVVDVHAFKQLTDAQKYYETLAVTHDANEDDLQLCETQLR